MNRFRTKKRAKDDLSASRVSEESDQSSMSFMGFRKGKKVQQEEVKKEIDLSTALPSNDDFRTSLLMSNLSARFSMLREQDDPNTKIGKASDDSVLYPKRQSRMADFGFSGGAGLTDIAEVESIKGTHFLRNSSASNDTDQGVGGSVMDRSRPTEGNNLFGGRQKIYKIPAGAEGGMTGRALYDDDVAMSAFQRWKQAERERALGELNSAAPEETEDAAEQTRPKSPPQVGYNRKRETSSTTSSGSIMGRNSTAATSVTSQAAAVAKDGQSTSSAQPSTFATPALERSVTRTRRLYEQGLTQDMQEQQASALSRIESLTRQRPLGTRTPDLSMSPTPQAGASASGFASNNRTVLAKASASSLKSTSPSSSAPLTGDLNLGIKTDSKPNLGASPPLSPPISETSEQPILAKDAGEAAAGSVLQKSPQSYNESQYIQRQLQLQQGRETPTQRLRTESNSATAPRLQDHEAKPATIRPRPPVPDARLPPTPVADTETLSSTVASLPGLSLLPEVNIERPSDNDHPAFRRQSAMPTPLSIGAKVSREPSPAPMPKISVEKSQQPSPEDSPTLGPAAGLSGLVRQHLRSESVESSVYGAGLDISGPESRFNLDSSKPSVTAEPEPKLGSWLSSAQDSTRSQSSNGLEMASERLAGGAQLRTRRDFSPDSKATDRNSNSTDDGIDEFASQLANARRRVREKLTSYVESDSSRATSPLLLPSDPPTQPASNPLGIGILKPKSSKGSLIDRSRNMVTGQSKSLKILGIGAGSTSTPPQSAKQSMDEKEFPSLETMREEISREDAVQPNRTSDEAETPGGPSPSRDQEDESNTHPGLRAFKQARRELQKRKELETLARHQISQTSQSPDQPLDQANGAQSQAWADRGARQRTPSRERRPPPVTYRQHPPSDEHGYNSPVSARPSGERDRSGSETSGGRSNSRPPRLRTNTNTGQHPAPHPGPHDQLGAPNYRQPMMRSPALPGIDAKGSPMMPPYPYAGRGGPSPIPSPHLDRSRSAANLGVHTGRSDPHSGQPSPISPMGLPSPNPYAMGPAGSPAGTPTSLGPRPRGPSVTQSPALGPSNGSMPGHMKRPVDKREISDPTFMSSTSRGPITTPHPPAHPPPSHPHYPPHSQYAPHSQYPPHPNQPPPMVPGMSDGGRPYGGSRSRSNSRAAGPVPPVPPINPRRRRDESRTRPSHDDAGVLAPRLPFASQANNSASSFSPEEPSRSAFASDDESSGKPDQRRRLQKPRPDMQGAGSRPFGRPRDVATSNAGANSGMGVPGGMI